MSFVHLHLHTQYSLLDGANKVKNLMPQVSAYGMPAVAMTDHGNMFGAIDFYRSAEQAGIKPIIGCEMYLAPKSRHDRAIVRSDDYEGGGNFHLILLAMNLDGYRNLCRLVSAGFIEGFYHKPRVDKELLRELNKGIIALSGCLSGELARAMLAGKEQLARDVVAEYASIFDDRFYIEIQANHLPEQEKINPALIEIAREFSLPLVATNDCHYLTADDAEAHEVLLAVQSGKVWSDEKRWRFGTDQLYVKSTQEMEADFAHCPQAISNTLEVANRCNLELSFGNFYFPVFAVPPEDTLEETLRKKAYAGLEDRFAQIQAHTPDWSEEKAQQYKDRLDFELKVIEKMGFSGYFLIVADFIGYAKSQKIPVGPGRGSAAGCLVAYSTRITDVDPIRYNLLFERFLNPGRKSMPDIDVDFCFERRDEVIRYIKEKYGADKVAQIITFGTLKGKQAIKDVGRVLEFPYADTGRIAKMYPAPKQGKDFPLEAALEMEPRLREIRDRGDREKKLFSYALKLEGLLRHASKHAAGIVISPTPLVEHLPLFVDKEGSVLTQYAGPEVDTIGLIKFDFLGLKTLTLLDDTVKRIKKSRNVEIDLGTLRIDDRLTYQKLTRGDTVGVFQMEGSGIRKLITQLKPSCFEDIVAVIALFRPGPLDSGAAEQFIRRKNGKDQISYPHPLLGPVLRETYGVTIYQEQVMQIAQVLAGYSLEDADNLRRAMGKKKKEVMQEERARFMTGAAKQKIPDKLAGEIFDAMETFAAYGFNKCLPGWATVIDARNGQRVKIADIVSGRTPDVWVPSFDEETLRIVARPVTGAFSSGHVPVYRMTTETGRVLPATANHPVYTPSGWKDVGDIQPGDYVALPRTLPYTPSGHLETHELVVMGYALSEGNLCHPASFYVYSTGEDEIADYVAHLEQFANTVAVVDRSKAAASVYAKRADRRESSGAVTFLRDLGLMGKTATEKFIPDVVYTLAPEQLALLLGRLWTGDGGIHPPTRLISYATSSHKLAQDVQHLLLRLGLMSRVHAKTFPYRGETREGYVVNLLGGAEAIHHFATLIGPHLIGKRRRDLDELLRTLDVEPARSTKDILPLGMLALIAGEVRRAAHQEGLGSHTFLARHGISSGILRPNATKRGIARRTVATLARLTQSVLLERHAQSDIYWDRVVSVEQGEAEEVYDLSVQGTHTFVAEDVIVHNSHAAAYALISYQTAYLKAHYPQEFMAALMSIEMSDPNKAYKNIAECRMQGIEVLPPDVNESDEDFTVTGKHIRFGLGAVKGVGSKAIDVIQAARNDGSFSSLHEFCTRVRGSQVNKRVLENLVRCGALDSFKAPRARLFAGLEDTMKWAEQKAKGDHNAAQLGLFTSLGNQNSDGHPELPNVEEWPDTDKLRHERDTLGFFITGHPLDKYVGRLHGVVSLSTDNLKNRTHQEKVRLAGVIHSLALKNNKKGDRYATFTLEDKEGVVEVIVWPEAYKKHEATIHADQPVFLRGALDIDDERCQIIADEVVPLESVATNEVQQVHIQVPADVTTKEDLVALKDVLAQHTGDCQTFLHLMRPDYTETVIALPNALSVAPTRSMLQAVERLFGNGMTSFR
ncbi:MAG: DNA polymerase III subunit alpha [Deltaproteobacteria bacterium]|nr:DNA polymerase III subunit alpha [Deltaproteobacteria bacterium]